MGLVPLQEEEETKSSLFLYHLKTPQEGKPQSWSLTRYRTFQHLNLTISNLQNSEK